MRIKLPVISPSTRCRASRGRSIIEYAVLVIIILTALYFMKGPILHALYGRWKTAGDSFAFGRQYDPKGTSACTHVTLSDNTGIWYDERCFDSRRGACDRSGDADAVAACEQGIMNGCTANCPKDL